MSPTRSLTCFEQVCDKNLSQACWWHDRSVWSDMSW